jgi:hypothetical protein
MESAADITANTILIRSHGLSVDHRVVIWPVAGLALPSPLLAGMLYYVGTVPDGNTITLSTSAANGAAVDITGTAPFIFLVQRCVPEFYVSAGAYGLISGYVDANLLS